MDRLVQTNTVLEIVQKNDPSANPHPVLLQIMGKMFETIGNNIGDEFKYPAPWEGSDPATIGVLMKNFVALNLCKDFRKDVAAGHKGKIPTHYKDIVGFSALEYQRAISVLEPDFTTSILKKRAAEIIRDSWKNERLVDLHECAIVVTAFVFDVGICKATLETWMSNLVELDAVSRADIMALRRSLQSSIGSLRDSYTLDDLRKAVLSPKKAWDNKDSLFVKYITALLRVIQEKQFVIGETQCEHFLDAARYAVFLTAAGDNSDPKVQLGALLAKHLTIETLETLQELTMKNEGKPVRISLEAAGVKKEKLETLMPRLDTDKSEIISLGHAAKAIVHRALANEKGFTIQEVAMVLELICKAVVIDQNMLETALETMSILKLISPASWQSLKEAKHRGDAVDINKIKEIIHEETKQISNANASYYPPENMNCVCCQQYIIGMEGVTMAGLHFHAACAVCACCGRELLNQPVYKKRGRDLLCEKHGQLPKAECNALIEEYRTGKQQPFGSGVGTNSDPFSADEQNEIGDRLRNIKVVGKTLLYAC